MLLSIIVVVKDDPTGLESTLNSIVPMSYDVEICIVTPFDNSATFRIASHFSNSHSNARLIGDQGDGIYQAMNEALKYNLNSEWIWFLNAGDKLHSHEAFDRLVKYLIVINKGIDWIYCAFTLCEYDGTRIETRKGPRNFTLTNQLFARNFVSHQTVIARGKTLRNLGGFDTRYKVASDWDLMCRLYETSDSEYLDINLVDFKLGGFSTQNRQLGNRELLTLRNKYLPSRFRIYSWYWFIYRHFRNLALVILETYVPTSVIKLRRTRATFRRLIKLIIE